MDIKAIEAKLEGYSRVFIDKGYFKPQSWLKISEDSRCEVFAVGQRNQDWSSGESEYLFSNANSVSDAFAKMDEKISFLEPRDKREKNIFISEVAELAEKARALGLTEVADDSAPCGHVDYAAWLKSLLDSLSKNILEDHRQKEPAE